MIRHNYFLMARNYKNILCKFQVEVFSFKIYSKKKAYQPIRFLGL